MLLMLGFITAMQAQTAGDQILGKWKNDQKNSQIEFQNEGTTYSAKLVWLAEPNDANGNPKLDKSNPDPKMRHQPVIGITMISGLRFDGKNWIDGIIYAPKRGMHGRCSLKIVNNQLHISVTKGLFSDTKIWSR